MKAEIYTALSLLSTMTAFALNDLGALEKAMKDHPAIFVSGNVIEYTIGNEICYVYNGEAEKCFEGGLAESDAELFQEAALDAKKNLYNFLTKGNKSLEVQISGTRKLYEFVEAKMRRVVLFVGKDQVSVIEKPKRDLAAVDLVASKPSAIAQDIDSQREIGAKSTTNITASANSSRVNRQVTAEDTSIKDMLPIYLDAIAKSPTDCISMSKAAKLYVRRNDIAAAKKMYSEIVKQVVLDERMDKEFAAGLLLEAAKFESANGDVDCALKYYRLIIRCDSMRRWSLHDQVDEANKSISQLLLKVQ